MLKMIRNIAILALVGSAALVASGCATTFNEPAKPYALTGKDNNIKLTEGERKEQLRWTDDKGHYRADLRMQQTRPLRYVP